MNVEFINPFFEASSSILNDMCSIKINKKQLFIKQGMMQTKSVTIAIGVAGMLKGNIIISTDKDTAINLASTMMGGMSISDLDEVSMSAVSELGNMIAGRAAMIFYDKRINIDITPPIPSLNQPNGKINYTAQTICVPLALSSGGEIEIDISLTEK